MNVKEVYNSKLMSAEEAAKYIKSHDKIYMGSFLGTPVDVLHAITDRYQELEGVEIVSCAVVTDTALWSNEDLEGHIHYGSVFVLGPFEQYFVVNSSRHSVYPVSFSRLRDFFQQTFVANVTIHAVSPMDEDGYMYFGQQGSSIADTIASQSERIVVQVSDHVFKIKGPQSRIHVSRVDAIVEKSIPLIEYPMTEPSELDEKIASYVMPFIPNGATIQLGIGGLANAIGYRLENHKDIKVFTEMLTESMINLYEKRVVKEKMIACFALGNRALYEFCNNNDMVELWQLPDLCNPAEIAKHDNFISVNTCLMVDFIGQVASEQVGPRIVACTGGASDTVRGARMSKGGRSFICLASTYTTKEGEVRSNIVSALPPYTPVTVQRTDVDAIVTEYGVADLYCRSNEERVAALINIAHPDFREGLKEEARKLKMLP